MTIEAIAIGIFLFVALTVGGLRVLNVNPVEQVARDEPAPYTGPLYNAHGRELEG